MKRISIGIIGCGAIAQVQYLPIFMDLRDEFEVGGIADLSANLLDAVGDQYGIPADRRFTDYNDLLDTDIDAVIVCPSGSHAPASIAAARKGKHVLVEKPICIAPDEAHEMAKVADETGVIMMTAYMKRYDPAYQYALARISEMSDVRFVQVNHLHPDNSLHLQSFRIHRFDDIPQAAIDALSTEKRDFTARALGISPDDLEEPIEQAYSLVLGSMIHDIGNLSGAFGAPQRVIHTEVWLDGRGVSTTLEYEDGKRAVCTWVDLPDLQQFEETLEVYGSRERVIVSFPTGFSLGLPSFVDEHGMDSESRPWRKRMEWQSNPFKLEVQHLRDCIISGKQPMTPLQDTVCDVELVRDIVLAYMNAQ